MTNQELNRDKISFIMRAYSNTDRIHSKQVWEYLQELPEEGQIELEETMQLAEFVMQKNVELQNYDVTLEQVMIVLTEYFNNADVCHFAIDWADCIDALIDALV